MVLFAPMRELLILAIHRRFAFRVFGSPKLRLWVLRSFSLT